MLARAEEGVGDLVVVDVVVGRHKGAIQGDADHLEVVRLGELPRLVRLVELGHQGHRDGEGAHDDLAVHVGVVFDESALFKECDEAVIDASPQLEGIVLVDRHRSDGLLVHVAFELLLCDLSCHFNN